MAINKYILRYIVGLLSLSLLATVGCAHTEKKTNITILAAASLTETFTELEKGFEADNPNIDLQLSFAGTSTLVTQVKEGLQADVFVSANKSSVDELILEGAIAASDAKVFAHNKLVVMVYNKSPYKIKDLEDLLQEGVKIVIAEPAQPIGKYTLAMLTEIDRIGDLSENFSVRFNQQVVSLENSVKGVATKVEMGEADAGIVYFTDFISTKSDSVTYVDIPDRYNQVATYEIAILKSSPYKKIAGQFVNYVLNTKGQNYLTEDGFLLPE